MTQDKISVLLGRPLSATETTNFNTYLDLAQNKVSDLICSGICAEGETKSFVPRHGYRTLNLPIFGQINSLKLDGVETDEYTAYQGSSLNGDWFNSVVFQQAPDCSTVEIDAEWGFYEVPSDVQKMIAEQFGIMSEAIDGDMISRKQVEDFSIQLNGTKSDAFAKKYTATIAKYSACTTNNVQHGATYGRVHYI